MISSPLLSLLPGSKGAPHEWRTSSSGRGDGDGYARRSGFDALQLPEALPPLLLWIDADAREGGLSIDTTEWSFTPPSPPAVLPLPPSSGTTMAVRLLLPTPVVPAGPVRVAVSLVQDGRADELDRVASRGPVLGDAPLPPSEPVHHP